MNMIYNNRQYKKWYKDKLKPLNYFSYHKNSSD